MVDLRKLQKAALAALGDIKAREIEVFDVTHLTSMFDRVIIASADSARQLKALAGHVQEKAKAAGGRVYGEIGRAHVFVAQRPGHSLTPGGMPGALAAEWRKRAGTPDVLRQRPGGNVVTYGTTALDISASAIRAHFAQARSPRYLLPSAVLDYIEAHGLYAQSNGAP